MDRKYVEKLRDRLKDKFVVAVTGVPGCGKSLFCTFMSKFGAHYISADKITAKLLTKKKCYSKILKEFGSSLFEGNTLVKEKLARAVFKNKGKRRWLENYLHPFIANDIYSEIKKSKKKIAVVEAPLLFESRFNSFADLSVCITSKLKNIKSRLKARGWTTKRVNDTAKAQFSQKKKAELCDLIVENNGTKRYLEARAKELLEFLTKLV